MKWKLCSPGKTYEAGEGRGVYFDAGSGDTHLVDHTTLAILRILAQAPLSLDEIAAQLAATRPDTELECSHLEDVLHELSTVDLVEIA
jgi:PqqD family protein of HPr-rel-A system